MVPVPWRLKAEFEYVHQVHEWQLAEVLAKKLGAPHLDCDDDCVQWMLGQLPSLPTGYDCIH